MINMKISFFFIKGMVIEFIPPVNIFSALMSIIWNKIQNGWSIVNYSISKLQNIYIHV
jgi:hypothetical protein